MCLAVQGPEAEASTNAFKKVNLGAWQQQEPFKIPKGNVGTGLNNAYYYAYNIPLVVGAMTNLTAAAPALQEAINGGLLGRNAYHIEVLFVVYAEGWQELNSEELRPIRSWLGWNAPQMFVSLQCTHCSCHAIRHSPAWAPPPSFPPSRRST